MKLYTGDVTELQKYWNEKITEGFFESSLINKHFSFEVNIHILTSIYVQ